MYCINIEKIGYISKISDIFDFFDIFDFLEKIMIFSIPAPNMSTIYRRKCKGTAKLQQHGCSAWLFQYPPSTYIHIHSE